MKEKEWKAKTVVENIENRKITAPRIEFDDNQQKVKLIDEEGGVKESFDYDEIVDLSLRLETK